MPKANKIPSDYFLDSGVKEIKLLRKHFHITGSDDNVHVSGEVTPEDVLNFYREYFTRIRPAKLSMEKILPQPNPRKLRALYMGESDANVLLNLIVRHILYVDQILIVDPFLTLILHDHPKSVLKRPQSWVSVIVNRALCLCALEDYIKQGLIVIIPNIFTYHPELLKIPSTLQNPPGFMKSFEEKVIRDLLLNENPENRDAMLDVFEKMGKEFLEDERNQLLASVEQYEHENPIRFRLNSRYFDKHFPEGQTRSEMYVASNGGLPLIHAAELAEKTGSFLVFEYQLLYEALCVNFQPSDEKTDSFQQLSLAFQALNFPFLHNVASKKALELRNKGYLLSFRNYLRELWQTVITTDDQQLLDAKISEFIDRLTLEYDQLVIEWEQIRKDLYVSAAVTGVSTALTIVAPGVIALGFAVATGGLGLAGYQNIKDLRQVNQRPLAVFLKLSH